MAPGARRVGAGIAAAGVLVLVLLAFAWPAPDSWEQWACCDGPGSAGSFAARGPVAARYDPAADATDVVFGCSHGQCALAAHVRGNATQLDGATHYLVAEGPVTRDVRSIVPIAHTTTFSPNGSAAQTTVTTFRLASPWPPMLARVFLAGAVAGGVALALRGARGEAGLASALAIAVLLLVAWRGVGAEGGFLLVLVAGVLVLLAALTAALGRGHRTARGVALQLALLALDLVAAVRLLGPYFPAPPTL